MKKISPTVPNSSEVAIGLAFMVTGFGHTKDVFATDQYQQHADIHGGYVGIVADMYKYAYFVEQWYADNVDPDAESWGVIAYDVSEPLGTWLFDHPDAFTGDHVSPEFADRAEQMIREHYDLPAVKAAQPEGSAMKISDLINQLVEAKNIHGDVDVLTRGSQPQKMVDAIEARVVKTTRRKAVFIGQPKAVAAD